MPGAESPNQESQIEFKQIFTDKELSFISSNN